MISAFSRALLGAGILTLTAGIGARAQDPSTRWFDDFDSYTPGALAAQSDWLEWTGSVNVDGMVSSAQSYSPPHSLMIQGNLFGQAGTDVVRLWNTIPGKNRGRWIFTIKTFVPCTATGTGFVILLSRYPSQIDWAMEINFDADNDMVSNSGGNMEMLPLIEDEWVSLTACVDITNDRLDVFYGDDLLISDQSWRLGTGAPGIKNIAACDIYAGEAGDPGISEMYLDDARLVEDALLEITPESLPLGTVVSLTACGGGPGKPGLLVISELAGSPTLASTGILGLMDSNGRWFLQGPVTATPPITPLDIKLRLLTLDVNSKLVQSNDELLSFP